MSGGSSGGESQTQQQETQLSREQAAVLSKRESQYQEIFFPEMVAELEESKLKTTDQPTLRAGVEATNRAAGQAEQQLTSDIAQRGLEGSGAEVQGLAALSGARQSALSKDFFAAQDAAKNRKLQLLQMGGAMSPTPTTAAPLSTSSTSEQKSRSGLLGLF